MAIKQQSGGAQPGNTASIDLIGVANAALQNQINALGEVDRSLTGSVSEPEIDLTFNGGLPVFRVDKKGVFATMAFLFPPGSIELIIQLVKQVERTVSQVNFDTLRFHTAIRDFSPDEVAAGRVVREFPTSKRGLEASTIYNISRLKVHTLSSGAGAEISNPEGDILFTDVPLYTFTTPSRFGGIPSDPRTADILLNSLDSFTEDFDVKVRVRIFSPLTGTGAAQTWAASQSDEVMPVFTRTNTGDHIKPKHLLVGVELTQTDAASPVVANRGYVDIDVTGFKPGNDYTWDKNVCWAQGDQAESTGAAVAFTAGSFSKDPTTLTSLSLTVTQDDSRRASVTLNFTQPATPVALKNCKVERSDAGAGVYNTIIRRHDASLRSDVLYTTGPQSELLRDSIKTKPNKTYDYHVSIWSVGNSTPKTFDQNGVVGSNALDVPSKSNQRTHKNMVEGGAFLVNRFDFDGTSPTTDVGKAWALSTAGTSTIDSLATGAGGASIDAGGVQWDQANHRLILTDNSPAGTGFFTLGGKVCCKIRKQIVAGETYNLTLMIKAATGYTGDFRCELWDHGNGAVIDGCTVNITSYAVTTTYTVMYALFSVASTYQMSAGATAKQWIRFSMPNANPSFDTYLDNWNLVRGEIPPAWAPGDEEAGIDSSVVVTVDTGVGVIGAVSGGMWSPSPGGGQGVFYGSGGSAGGPLIY